jgi:hypothetical protein
VESMDRIVACMRPTLSFECPVFSLSHAASFLHYFIAHFFPFSGYMNVTHETSSYDAEFICSFWGEEE